MKASVPISVLMTAYNAEKFIGEAIQSVLQQTFTDFEFIIVNDGSTDGTRDIIYSFNDERIKYTEQANSGIAQALNHGLQKANGTFIARFDADDICYPQRLQKQYEFIKAFPQHSIIGSSVDYIDQDGEYIFTFSAPGPTSLHIDTIKWQTCPFIHSSVMYQKETVLKNDGYNPLAHSFEDHLLWLSILKNGNGYNIQEPLIKVRLNPDSITIDENWRPRKFHIIKNKVLQKESITEDEGRQLQHILESQNTREIKEGAYHALLAKKFLWNNYEPLKARAHLKKSIAHNKWHWKSYILFVSSFLPPLWLTKGYQWFKSRTIYPGKLLKTAHE